ncbi:MAG: hypothetical protein RLZZ528_505 [Pseudomonadota bacterium]
MRLARYVLAGVAMLPGQAGWAETESEVLFSHKSWEVRAVWFDDGSASCVAQVSDGSDSFSVWGNGDQSIRLQFYSDAWDFGEGDTADLEVEVDRRGEWSLTNAELYLQSVLFDIPDSDDGVAFLTEVMRGNSLYLRNDAGEGVMTYSLSGSSASIQALIDCVAALDRPANPFN